MENSKRVSEALEIATNQLLSMDRNAFLELLEQNKSGDIGNLLDGIGYFESSKLGFINIESESLGNYSDIASHQYYKDFENLVWTPVTNEPSEDSYQQCDDVNDEVPWLLAA